MNDSPPGTNALEGGAGARTGLGHVQSLVRAFHLLDLLVERDDGLNLTELAKDVNLPPDTPRSLE